MGGTNVHMLVKEANALTPLRVVNESKERGTHMVVLSAQSRQALIAQCNKLRAHLQVNYYIYSVYSLPVPCDLL